MVRCVVAAERESKSHPPVVPSGPRVAHVRVKDDEGPGAANRCREVEDVVSGQELREACDPVLARSTREKMLATRARWSVVSWALIASHGGRLHGSLANGISTSNERSRMRIKRVDVHWCYGSDG
jgi:hypothetical protein